MLSGDDGIMTNAQKAQAANTEGEVREKFQMAYNAIKTKISVEGAIDPNFDATNAETIKMLFEEAVKEIGLEPEYTDATEETTKIKPVATLDGYTITYAQGTDPETSTKVYLEYRDNKFGGSGNATLGSATVGNSISQTDTEGNQKINGQPLNQIRATIEITPDNAVLHIDDKQVLDV